MAFFAPMGDEYTALGVFFAGVVAQALLFARSVRGALGALAIAPISLAAAWYFTRNEDDRAFGLPVMATLLFVLVFALLFRDSVLPRVTASLVLHYTLLGLYALYAFWTAGPMPLWILGWFLVPLLTATYLLAAPAPGKLGKIVAYVCFLLLLSYLVGRQLSAERLKEIQNEQGFGLALYAYVFVAGMVFLYLASNALYLLLLIPSTERRSIFWDALAGGSGPDPSAEHRDALASKVVQETPTPIGAALLVGHAVALWINWRLELVSPGTALNASVVALGFLSAIQGMENESG